MGWNGQKSKWAKLVIHLGGALSYFLEGHIAVDLLRSLLPRLGPRRAGLGAEGLGDAVSLKPGDEAVRKSMHQVTLLK